MTKSTSKMSDLHMAGMKLTESKMIVRTRSLFHCLVAACLVPLLVIGGPGSPVASALASTKNGEVRVLPTIAPPMAHRGASTPSADTLDWGGPGRRPEPNGIATSVRPSRLFVIEQNGKAPIDASRLNDGDATTTVSPENGSSLRIIVEFAEPLWLDGVSVFGDQAGELRLLQAGGAQALESEVGSGSGWRRFGFEHPIFGQTFHFDWTPGALELPAEWAFWQRGSSGELALGGTPTHLLAVGAFRGGAEHRAEPGDAVVSGRSVGGQAGAKFRFALPELEGVRRAFLVYELAGAAHFSQVRRSLNGLAPLGRARFAGGKGGLQVEEIPVAGLRAGANEIEFRPANPLITPEYRVRQVRIVTVGGDQAVQTLSFDHGEAGQARRARAYFDVPVAPVEAAFFLRHRSEGKISLRGAAHGAKAPGNREQQLVELSGMKPGWHTVALPSGWRALDAIEAALNDEVRLGTINEVLLSGLAMPGQAEGGIVLSYPESGECFDGQAVVRGFVEGVQNPRLSANGRSVDVLEDGSFELTIDGEAERSWEISLTANGEGQSGAKLQKVMQPCLLARPGSSAARGLAQDGPVQDVGAPFAQVVTEEGGVVEFAGARLEIPKGALTEPTRITIRPLPASEVSPMNPGMTNVTPLGQAYAFGPHGLEFQGPVQLTLPYDEAAVPPAASVRHVAGYFFDESQARWVQVGRAGEANGGLQSSFTHHFTDFINATIATPDAPGGSTFAPTEMNGIDAGDPLAGMMSIAAPSANPFGTAGVSLPLELPPGRAGMTPSLALVYDSNQKSSMVGYGWQLAGLSRIELDTRFGVPDYDHAFTQTVPGSLAGKLTYALDGAQLTEVGSVSGGTQFRRRVEGSFQHIVQLGSGAGKYFEVTAQDGTKSTYGKTADARDFDRQNPSHIFAWHLETVQDVFGNRIEYEYDRVGGSIGESGPTCDFDSTPAETCAFELVPSRIKYTMHANVGLSGRFDINFTYSPDARSDARVNGRAGFLTYEGAKLERIDIKFAASTGVLPVRSYTLEYQSEAYADLRFHKQLLERVTQLGTDGQEFSSHFFSYSRPDGGVSTAFQYGPWVDAFEAEQVLATNASSDYSLSRRNGWNVNIAGSFGIGFGDLLGISVSASTNFGSTWDSHTFVDVSGDGLPDYLNSQGFAQLGQYEHGNWGLDLLGTPQPYLGVDYDELDGAGDSMLDLTVSGGLSAGVSANAFGLGAEGDASLSANMDFRTLADMDGDGFDDRVEVVGGMIIVYLNQGSGDGPQTFSSPVAWGDATAIASLSDDPLDPQTDPLIRWVAPRAGTIQLGGEVRQLSGGAYGSQTSIYHYHQGPFALQTDTVWTRSVPETDSNVCVPSEDAGTSGCGGTPLELTVAPGDSLFFRLHPRSGFQQADRVQWQPEITYTDAVTADVEPYGLPVDSFSLEEDFRLGSGLSMPASAALTGKATLGGTLTKFDTADRLTARIVRVDVDANGAVLGRTTLQQWDVQGEATLPNQPLLLEVPNVPLELGALLDFELTSDAPVDPSRVTWAPFIRYTQAEVPDSFPGESDVEGPVVCSVVNGVESCVVNGAGKTVPLPPSSAHRAAQVSFITPFSTPTERTNLVRATGSSVHINGTLSRNQNNGAVIGLCQTTHRLLWKGRVEANSSTDLVIDEELLGLAAADPVVCSVRSEGTNPQDGALDLTITGADPTTDFVNRRSESPNIVGEYGGAVQEWESLAGGFHHWSFGDWDSAQPFSGQTVVVGNLQGEQPPFFPASPGYIDLGTGPEMTWKGRRGTFVNRQGVMQPGIVSAGDGLDGGGFGFGALAARISHSVTYGGGVHDPLYSAGKAESQYIQDRDLIDINGDGFPDNVTEFGVSYNTGRPCSQTPCNGGFVANNELMGTTPTATWTKITKTRVGLNVLEMGGGATSIRVGGDGVPASISSAGLGLGTDFGRTTTNRQLIDMNGDGLPDYVNWDHDDGDVWVELNLGYKRTAPVKWPKGFLQTSSEGHDYPVALIQGVSAFEEEATSEQIDEFMDVKATENSLAYSEVTTVTPSAGAGVELGFAGGGGGAAYQYSIRRDLGRFMDMTGDGLPDYVFAEKRYTSHLYSEGGGALDDAWVWLHIQPNLGSGFGPTQIWRVPEWSFNSASDHDFVDLIEALNTGDTTSLDALGASESADWTLFQYFHFCFFFCISATTTEASVDQRSVMQLRDVNGDHLPDFVMKQDGQGDTLAKVNKLGGTNLLTKIWGPAGRITTLHYGSEGATHEQPGASFVMKQVDVEDGQGNTYVTKYEYERSGKTNRSERQFLGYGEVGSYRPNGSSVRTLYSNTDFYRKGLPTERTVNAWYPADSAEKTLLRETFDYEPPVDLAVGGWHHPAEVTRTRSLLEEQVTGPTTTETRTWDPTHGNLTSIAIEGDETAKDVTYLIDYISPAANVFRPSRVRAVGGNGVTYRYRRAEYGGLGQLTRVADYNTSGTVLLSDTQILSRDPFGNPTTIQDATGGLTTYEFEEFLYSHVYQVTDPYGVSSTALYDYRFAAPKSVVDGNGNTTSYSYDAFGRLATFTGALDQGTGVPTVVYEYGPIRALGENFQNAPVWAKRRHKDVSQNASGTSLGAHDFIDVVSFADGLGRVIQTKKDLTRDTNGTLEVGMTVSGKVEFDSQGRPIETGQPVFSIAPSTQFIPQTDPVNPTIVSYDDLDRVVQLRTPLDDSPNSFVTTTTTFGHQQAVTNGVLKHLTTVQVSDANGPVREPRHILRDADGEIAEIHEYNQIGADPTPALLVTSYATNAMNELQSVVDPGGNTTTTLYDALGRKRQMTSPDMGLVKWTYRPDGQVATVETAQLRAKGQITTYQYDRSRLIGVDYQDGNSTDITFTYGTPAEAGPANGNLAGRIKSQTSEAGMKEFQYDAAGNVSREVMTLEHKVDPSDPDVLLAMTYNYDSFGRMLETRFLGPDREVVSYAYDEGGNLQSVYGQRLGFNPAGLALPHHTTYLAHRGYNEFGQVESELAGNLIPTTYAYGERSRRLDSLDRGFVNENVYEYDPVGNILDIQNFVYDHEEAGGIDVPSFHLTFSYDNLDQLRTATGLGSVFLRHFRYALEQEYDELGNITLKDQASFISPMSTTMPEEPVDAQTYRNTYTYDAPVPHAPSRIQGEGVATDYQYDPSGNRQQTTRLSETRQLTWTEDDRLRSIKRANEPYDLVRNYYDAQGQKTISLHPGATSTEEVFHAGALTLRADGNSYATTKHIYAGGQRLASKMDHRWFTEDPVQYYATDHLGSTNFTFDSVGNVISHTEYFPSGEIWRSETLASHSGINQYQFTGKEWDDVTGLYDFGYRSYDPVVGQWLSPDPAFDGLNLYAYVHNNPVNLVDPFGLSAVRGEDSQITWSNRTLDDNGVTSHFEDGEFHDPYRDDSGVQAPTYDDFRQQAYEDARNQQRAEAYIKSSENDFNQLRYEPLNVADSSGTWRAGMEAVMLLAPAGPVEALVWKAAGRAIQRLAPAAARAGAKAGRLPKACFVAGTLVLTREGKKPIEEVEAGDEVWSYDYASDGWKWSKVTRTLEHAYHGDLILLQGGVTATGNHPFCVASYRADARERPLDIGDDNLTCAGGGRWVAAGELLANDTLFGVSGAVPAAGLLRSGASVPVYNLEIEGAHTYVVGHDQLLVHNKGNARRKPGKLGQFKGRDALRAENRVARDAGRKAGLNKEQMNELHKEISGQGYDYQTVLQIAEDIAKGY